MIRSLAALLLLSTSALAQSVTPGAGPVTALYVTGASVASTADINEDVLQTYTLPANTLANAGDRLRIYAGGSALGSTDNKNARLRIAAGAGGIMAAANLVTASGTRWAIYTEIVKTGAGTQTANSLGHVANSTNSDGLSLVTATVPDNAPIVIQVTGQNATNPTAGSVTCGYFSVELVRAPSS